MNIKAINPSQLVDLNESLISRSIGLIQGSGCSCLLSLFLSNVVGQGFSEADRRLVRRINLASSAVYDQEVAQNTLFLAHLDSRDSFQPYVSPQNWDKKRLLDFISLGYLALQGFKKEEKKRGGGKDITLKQTINDLYDTLENFRKINPSLKAMRLPQERSIHIPLHLLSLVVAKIQPEQVASFLGQKINVNEGNVCRQQVLIEAPGIV
jgi:hypothetical protein